MDLSISEFRWWIEEFLKIDDEVKQNADRR